MLVNVTPEQDAQVYLCASAALILRSEKLFPPRPVLIAFLSRLADESWQSQVVEEVVRLQLEFKVKTLRQATYTEADISKMRNLVKTIISIFAELSPDAQVEGHKMMKSGEFGNAGNWKCIEMNMALGRAVFIGFFPDGDSGRFEIEFIPNDEADYQKAFWTKLEELGLKPAGTQGIIFMPLGT